MAKKDKRDTVRGTVDRALDEGEREEREYRDEVGSQPKTDWTPQSAMETIMRAIPDIGKYDEAIGVVMNAINREQSGGNTTDDGWYQRFTELQDAYVRRWGEYVDGANNRDDTVRETVDRALDAGERRARDFVRIEDLNMMFDGRTE